MSTTMMKRLPLLVLSGFLGWSGAVTAAQANHAPVALKKSIATNEDKNRIFLLSGKDSDGDKLTFKIVKRPSHGKLLSLAPPKQGAGTIWNSKWKYIPAKNYNGTDTFYFKVSDGKLDSKRAKVSISVAAVNDRPIARKKSVSTRQEQPVSFLLVGKDADHYDRLEFLIVERPKHGTLRKVSTPRPGKNDTWISKWKYTPTEGYYGQDTFRFKTTDGTLDSRPALVTIGIAREERPFCFQVETNQDNRFTIPTNGKGYDYRVDCDDDGKDEATGVTGDYTCTYPTSGVYTIAIRGAFPQIYFNNKGDKENLLAIEEWGTQRWRSMRHAFHGCEKLELHTPDKPDLSGLRDMSYMFTGAKAFNQYVGD